MRQLLFIATKMIAEFLLQSHFLQAQNCDTLSKHFPGAVLLRAERKQDTPGKIIHGCIKLMNNAEMHVAPKITDSAGITDRYYGRNALAYWYVANNDTAYYLNGGSELTDKWLFIKRIINGPMELYWWEAKGYAFPMIVTCYDYYYVRKDGKWLNKKPVVWNLWNKRKQLNAMFADCPVVLERIATTEDLMLPEAMFSFVNLYNSNCARQDH